MSRESSAAGGFVLVGGQSQRMGRDKARLELAGQPLFLRAVDLLRPYVTEVVLLGPADPFASFGLPVIPDRFPGRGPLEALRTGLESSSFPWNVFLACDLPFLPARFVEFLVRRALACSMEAVVPQTADGWQPLCAAYHQRCLPAMERALAAGLAGIIDVLPRLRVKVVEAQELARHGFAAQMFKNVNTEQDWETARRELETGRK